MLKSAHFQTARKKADRKSPEEEDDDDDDAKNCGSEEFQKSSSSSHTTRRTRRKTTLPTTAASRGGGVPPSVFSLSSSRDDETHRNSFGGIIRFARAKAKLNIKSSGIDMVHASHILCGQNRTLCEDVMEWLEPLAENEAMRPKLEMGFEELARRFSRCPTGKRNGGDLGYFPRGEMTKDFDGTRAY